MTRPLRAARPAPYDESRGRPLYARALRLRHIRPNGALCFLFFEGTVAAAVLLTLAELVSWWAILLLPACVAVMVKVNDVIAGSSVPPPDRRRVTIRQRSVPHRFTPGQPVGPDPADTPAARRRPSGTPPGRPQPATRSRSSPLFVAADPVVGSGSVGRRAAHEPRAGADPAPLGGRARWPDADADHLDPADRPTEFITRPAGDRATGRRATPAPSTAPEKRAGGWRPVGGPPAGTTGHSGGMPQPPIGAGAEAKDMSADPATPDQSTVAPRVEPWWTPELGPDVPINPAEPFVPGNVHPVAPLDAREQWSRQSGSRRYD